MHSSTQNSANINLNLGAKPIDNVIGFPAKVWHTTKKYSINNTLLIAASNTWLQFSLAYIAAVVITSNDVSFITNILNSQAMPAYALASVILGIILLTSLAIKYTNEQEIKDERSKDGDSTIDEKIRSGQSDGINEIAQDALTIEIIPDTSLIGNKKENFSIVLPISEKQGEILENKRQENRNKTILLTVPYMLSGLILVGALAKFGFVNIRDWKEWTFIAVVGIIAIAGACVTLSKLKSNEVNNANNIVKKFNNLDILLPWRKGRVLSVMENKFESKEENDPISRLEKLFDKHLTNLINRGCYLFKNDLLDPSNANIEKTLDGMKKDVEALLDNLEEIIKQNLDGVEETANEAIIQCLKNIDESVDKLCKGVGKGVQNKLGEANIKDLVDNLSRLAETLEDRIARLKPGGRMGLSGASFADTRLPNAPGESRDNRLPPDEQISSGEECDTQRVDWTEGVKEIGQLKKKIKALERKLEKKKNNQNSSDSDINSETSSTISNDSHQNEEEILDEELAKLEKEERIREKRERIKKLKKEHPEQEEIKKWQKSINGKASEFLYYLLKFIKLEEKDDQGKEVGKATLRNFNNKVIIRWKDGSQTICHIKGQGNLLSTKVDFVDHNIHAAFKEAYAR